MEKKVIEYCTPVSKVITIGIKSRIMEASPGSMEGEIQGQNEDD